MKYHSALSKELDNLQSTPSYENEWGVAFKHDVTAVHVPNEYNVCDVMYTEIAWTQGVEKFNERVGKTIPYENYIQGINRIINEHINTKPIFIVAGKKEAKLLDQRYITIASKLNGAECMIYCYNILPDMYLDYSANQLIRADVKMLLQELSLRYKCIGDFCCGYGRAGVIFTANKKRYVMSDYNGKCITYIKNYYESIQKD